MHTRIAILFPTLIAETLLGQKLYTQKSESILPMSFTVSASWQKGSLVTHNREDEFTTQRKEPGTYLKCSVSADDDTTVHLSKRDWFLLLVLIEKLRHPMRDDSDKQKADEVKHGTAPVDPAIAAAKQLLASNIDRSDRNRPKLNVLDELELSVYFKKLTIKLLDEISDRGGHDPALVLRFGAFAGNLTWLANRFSSSIDTEIAIDYGECKNSCVAFLSITLT